ncbi:MAG TPA: helix-turn-helix transcriptional regulator [Vicinamibacterales bacterium]|nr:helix-turn-helix transcriptional regulator [Vicinamibacterales bacterium]
MSKALPDITHLQFLVLAALSDGDHVGRELRSLLAAHGVRSSAPAFYQMMGRLEDASLVDGEYDQRVVGGQHVKERRYRLTKAGARAVAETQSFYLDRLAARRAVRKGSHA